VLKSEASTGTELINSSLTSALGFNFGETRLIELKFSTIWCYLMTVLLTHENLALHLAMVGNEISKFFVHFINFIVKLRSHEEMLFCPWLFKYLYFCYILNNSSWDSLRVWKRLDHWIWWKSNFPIYLHD
jgi:hypothetical protein